METPAEFKVQFSGLKPGKHHFEFMVGDSFFEKLEYAPIKTGEVEVHIELEKRSTMLVLNFELCGWVGANCDRCAVAYRQPISGVHRVFVKFGDQYDEPDDDLLVIPRTSHELDVSQLIYEFIGLNIPLRKVPCDEGNDRSMCDRQTLDVLNQPVSNEKKDNPMWVALNEIKDQLKE